MDKSLIDLLTLNAARGIGSIIHDRLIHHFGNLGNVFKAGKSELEQVLRVGPKLAEEIIRVHKEGLGEKELRLAEKSQIKIIAYNQVEYPENLKTIFDYPMVLYVKGELKPSDTLAIAVVGTRRPSYYGQSQAERLSYSLAQRGICIVSGLARGIDTKAHQGALKAKTKDSVSIVGRTIAVLGSGLLNIYPAENKKLVEQISESSAVISELPLQTPPDSRNFPMRNRIISGLALGVLVIEAPRRSGALITADLALEQGREVFALPGKVDSINSQGCHKLIKLGAKLVEDIDDIIEELRGYEEYLSPQPRDTPSKGKRTDLDSKEATILELLSHDEPKGIDEISLASGLPTSMVSSTLLVMELKKLVKQLPGSNYVLI